MVSPPADAPGQRRGFLPGYTNDIFLSYAHVDNVPDRPDEEKKGWVDRFDIRLRVALWKRLGERATIWRDSDDLKRADKINPAISGGVAQSALFLTLISNRYLKSESCGEELGWIEKSCANDRRIAADQRVYPVLLYDIPNERRPAICRDRVGFDFHAARGDGPGRPLDPRRERNQFTDALDALVDELVERLVEIRTALEPAPVRAPTTVAGYRVFLTATPGMRLGQRARIREMLGKEGIDVLDVTLPPPYPASRHEEELRKILAQVDLSVHLLDEQAGPPLEEAPERCFPEEQCRLVYEAGHRQLVVLPEYFDLAALEVPSHRALLDRLSRSVWPTEKVSSLLSVGRARQDEAICELIREQRERTIAPAMAGSAITAGTVFVDLNTRDLAGVGPLFEFLEKKNLEPITIPSSSAAPGAYRASFVDHVTRAAALIIVYGDASLDWVKARAQNAYHLIIEKELQLKPIVFALPPAKPLKTLAFLQCTVVDSTGGFNETGLASVMPQGVA